ncbi:MAG: sugar phosphate isomerase/epimerase [Kiritimatiellae bacterium]|nr:sugar phosphate isomerase/epimerase [Kiritimatiellia bacterium]
MKLSFSTLACPEWDLARITAAAVAAGYAAVDFRGYRDASELTDSPAFAGEALRDTAMRISDAGLEVSCLSSGARMSVSGPADRAAQLDAMRRYADLCAPLRCKMVRIFGGDAANVPDPVGNAAETLVAASAIARERGIVFAVETHDSWTSTAKLRSAFDAAGAPEGVALLWDVKHPWHEHGETPETSLRNLWPYVANTHWKDAKAGNGGGARLRLPGEGDAPLAEAFDALESAGYGGWYTFEWEKRWLPEIEEPEIAVPRFAAFMRGLAEKRAAGRS